MFLTIRSPVHLIVILLQYSLMFHILRSILALPIDFVFHSLPKLTKTVLVKRQGAIFTSPRRPATSVDLYTRGKEKEVIVSIIVEGMQLSF